MIRGNLTEKKMYEYPELQCRYKPLYTKICVSFGLVFNINRVDKDDKKVVIFCASPGSSEEDDSISNHATALPSPWTWAFPLRFYFHPGKGFCSHKQEKNRDNNT